MKKHLDLIEDGESVFLDSNILIYVATRSPRYYGPCRSLLNKIDSGRLKGFVSLTVLTELFHRLAMIEIARKFHTNEPAEHAKQNPSVWKMLSQPYNALDELSKTRNLEVIDESLQLFQKAVSISRASEFMISDAKIAAACLENGVQNIATADTDFERANLVVWTP
jgi:predicted nucleic acid-binding protein